MNFFKEQGCRIWKAYESFTLIGGSGLAAATAYFIGLSLFPLLTVLIACVGLFLRYTSPGQDAQVHVMQTVSHHVSPLVASQIAEMLGQVQHGSSTKGPIGLLLLLLTAIGGFGQFEEAFDRIWRIPPPKDSGIIATARRIFRDRMVAFLMLLSMSLVVVLAFLASTVMAAVQAHTRNILPAPDGMWTLAQTGMSLAINFIAFTVLYRWLPKTHVPLKDAAQGAAVVAVAWEIGRQLLAAYLIGTTYSSAYGVVGTFIGLLVWCYYACLIVFVGGEYVRVCPECIEQVQAENSETSRLQPAASSRVETDHQ